MRSDRRAAATRRLCIIAPWCARTHLSQLALAPPRAGASYLQRISVLYGIRELSIHDDLKDLADALRFLLLRGLKDPVANVRFVAAQVAEEIVDFCPPSIADTLVKPALAQVAANDSDSDVRYFANKALEHCTALAH